MESKRIREIIRSPLAGQIIPLEETGDPVFAGKVLGDGAAVMPAQARKCKVFSPVDGEISALTDTLHALCITSDEGAELMIHVGRDTVELKGKPFSCKVKGGQHVRTGQLLMEFNLPAIQAAGLDPVTPVIVSNWEDYQMEVAAPGPVQPGDPLITLYEKG